MIAFVLVKMILNHLPAWKQIFSPVAMTGQMNLPAQRAGLPGHVVAGRKRANETSFILCPLTPPIPLWRDGALAGQGITWGT